MPAVAIQDVLIPIQSGQAVGRGWMAAHGHKPTGVTWHWTATRDLATCTRVLGGAHATRRGQASAHYGVGRSFAEGIDRYVTLENRSWHAGKNQTVTWDGRERTRANDKASRTTIGVETVNIGYARDGVRAGTGWIRATVPNGRHVMKVQPWTDPQMELMVQVGEEILDRWPHIGVRDHHGHHDICPGYKDDVVGFPFAELLRALYPHEDVADVWTPFLLAAQRQRALSLLGYPLGDSGPGNDGVDGDWGRLSDGALLAFQRDRGIFDNGMWSTFVGWEMHAALTEAGVGLEEVATG